MDTCWVIVAHAFNPNTWEAEAGGFLSSRTAWAIYTEKPCLEKTKKKKKKKKKDTSRKHRVTTRMSEI